MPRNSPDFITIHNNQLSFLMQSSCMLTFWHPFYGHQLCTLPKPVSGAFFCREILRRPAGAA